MAANAMEMDSCETRSISTVRLSPPCASMACASADALAAVRVVSTTKKPSLANFWAMAPPMPQRMPTGKWLSSSTLPCASFVLRPSACHLEVAPTTTATCLCAELMRDSSRLAVSIWKGRGLHNRGRPRAFTRKLPRSPSKERVPMSGENCLAGMKVLDLTQFEAGPSCTEALAWMGADVVKVENPKSGDPGRTTLGAPGRDSNYFLQYNANKRSVAVNLKDPRGVDLVKALARHADVMIENFAPGAIERLGLGPDVIRAVNPSIIYCQVKV